MWFPVFIYFYFTRFDIRLTYFSFQYGKSTACIINGGFLFKNWLYCQPSAFPFQFSQNCCDYTHSLWYLHQNVPWRSVMPWYPFLRMQARVHPVCLKICAERCGITSSGCALLYAFSIFSRKASTILIVSGRPLLLINTKLLYPSTSTLLRLPNAKFCFLSSINPL